MAPIKVAKKADLVAEIASRESADAILTVAAAAAQATADAALPKAGGTMTGKIVLDGDPTANLHPATRQYVLAQIAALIDGAPGTLDTLNEIAAALGDDQSAIDALTSQIVGALFAANNLADLADVAAARSNLGLGSAALAATGAFDTAGAAAAAAAASQPLNAGLTAIAALTSTNYGLALLELANAAAGRTALGAAAAADLTATLAVYRTLLRVAGRATVVGAAGTKYILLAGISDTSAVSSIGASAAAIFWRSLLATSYAVSGYTTKLRVSGGVLVAGTPPGVTITFGLYPITTAGGNISLGTRVADSAAVVVSPTSNTNTGTVSADFDLPTDGNYAIGYELSGTPAAGMTFQAGLDLHHIPA
jgi:hypothetical protein